MSSINAAIGREQLKKFPFFAERRGSLAERYQERLQNQTGVTLLDTYRAGVVPHIFVVRIAGGKRDALFDALRADGMEVGIHYYPNHLLSLFKSPYALPIAEQLGGELLTLPIHPSLELSDVDAACEQLVKTLASL
jgi:dTDP-4-amino-4,6-dideoxygalactose transaminase